MAPLVVEKHPRPQNRRPQWRSHIYGNSHYTLWDERTDMGTRQHSAQDVGLGLTTRLATNVAHSQT